MKISELVDDLSNLFGPEKQAPKTDEHENVQDISEQEVDEPPTDNVMIPPLQQKIELLKRAVNVDNFYDDQEAQSRTAAQQINLTINVPQGQSNSKLDLTINGQQVDDVQQLKRLAGVPVATIFDAGDDEPLDS